MLIFVDGCDVYSSETQVLQRWNAIAGSNNVQVSTTGGRFGGGCIRFLPDEDCWLAKYLTGTDTVYFGAAFRRRVVSNEAVGSQQLSICQFRGVGGNHLEFRYAKEGGVISLHDSAGTLLAQQGNTFDAGAWRFVEFGAHIDETEGWAECRINGDTMPIIRYDGNTKRPAATSNDVIELRISGGNTYNVGTFVNLAVEIDDIYIGDGNAGPRMGFQGDCKVVTDIATADVAQNGYTSTGAAYYTEVDDGNNPDGDTTRIVGTEVGHYATFSFPPLSETPDAIYAVSVTHSSRKTDAGTGWVAGRAVDGEDVVVGPASSVGSSYRYDQSLLTAAPDGGSWTKAKVDAASFGVEIVAAP